LWGRRLFSQFTWAPRRSSKQGLQKPEEEEDHEEDDPDRYPDHPDHPDRQPGPGPVRLGRHQGSAHQRAEDRGPDADEGRQDARGRGRLQQVHRGCGAGQDGRGRPARAGEDLDRRGPPRLHDLRQVHRRVVRRRRQGLLPAEALEPRRRYLGQPP